jgi:hypothetical protein
VTDHAVEKLTTKTALENHKDMRVILEGFMKSYYIRVIQLAYDGDLRPQGGLRIGEARVVNLGGGSIHNPTGP